MRFWGFLPLFSLYHSNDPSKTPDHNAISGRYDLMESMNVGQ